MHISTFSVVNFEKCKIKKYLIFDDSVTIKVFQFLKHNLIISMAMDNVDTWTMHKQYFSVKVYHSVGLTYDIRNNAHFTWIVL